MGFSYYPAFLDFLFSPDKKFTLDIKQLTGSTPRNLKLYKLAVKHSSTTAGKSTDSNERLEFLGDAVLNLVVAEYLFKKFPLRDEGYLTELRSKMVSRNQLNNIARKMGVDSMLHYNKNDLYLSKNSISGNALEALIGAVYIDLGFKATKKFIANKLIRQYLDIAEVEASGFNYKSKLLEWGQKNSKIITFKVLSETRVNRNTLFKVAVMLDEEEFSLGEDFNKKNAEKNAAKEAYQKLGLS